MYRRLNHFNPRSLAGATFTTKIVIGDNDISIHAPSRERLPRLLRFLDLLAFQSTLPRGSDPLRSPARQIPRHFNPRSLAGATAFINDDMRVLTISIHAPSRERLNLKDMVINVVLISIHAPSRERPPC